MKESKLFKGLVATFVMIVLGGPAVVLASTSSNFEDAKARVSVSYADLNLENEEGARVLYRRLQCYREKLSNAVDKFDNEDLARIHAG